MNNVVGVAFGWVPFEKQFSTSWGVRRQGQLRFSDVSTSLKPSKDGPWSTDPIVYSAPGNASMSLTEPSR